MNHCGGIRIKIYFFQLKKIKQDQYQYLLCRELITWAQTEDKIFICKPDGQQCCRSENLLQPYQSDRRWASNTPTPMVIDLLNTKVGG